MITMVRAELGEGPHPRKGTHCGPYFGDDDDDDDDNDDP